MEDGDGLGTLALDAPVGGGRSGEMPGLAGTRRRVLWIAGRARVWSSLEGSKRRSRVLMMDLIGAVGRDVMGGREGVVVWSGCDDSAILPDTILMDVVAWSVDVVVDDPG